MVCSGFVPRERDLARLGKHLAAVEHDGMGRMVSVRGPRRAGKSRLLADFVKQSALPHLFFTASRLAPRRQELAIFATAARRSTLPGRQIFNDVELDRWSTAFRTLASALSDEPAIMVVDNFPWLVEGDVAIEGQLKTAWDRLLEAKLLLLVLVGSDIGLMRTLAAYDRPLFGIARHMVVEPVGAVSVD